MNELRKIIRSFELTQGDVAESIGVSRATVARILNKESLPRNVTLALLDNLAGVVGYEVLVQFRPISDFEPIEESTNG